MSGAFCFCERDAAALTGKDRAAFRSGFLGVRRWGWSTLVQIVHASEEDRRTPGGTSGQQLVEQFGAPDLATARPRPKRRSRFVETLCTHPIASLIAVHRTVGAAKCGKRSAGCS